MVEIARESEGRERRVTNHNRVFTYGSLFSGIGGFDLGLDRAGMTCLWQVEKDPFCQQVLNKHWPDIPKYGDIREINPANLPPVDLICGGFPCQPFSVAGKQRGKEDDRYLWPEMLRIIEGLRPAWVFGENVPGIIRLGLDTALSDLEATGYAYRTFVVPACALGAPHRRDRVWIVAHTGGTGFNICPAARDRDNKWKAHNDIKQRKNRNKRLKCLGSVVAHAPSLSRHRRNSRNVGETTQNKETHKPKSSRFTFIAPCRGSNVPNPQIKPIDPDHNRKKRKKAGGGRSSNTGWRPTQCGLGGTPDGISERLDEPNNPWSGDWEAGTPRVTTEQPDRVNRLKALGNAVVPQIVEIFGNAILQFHKRMQCNDETNG